MRKAGEPGDGHAQLHVLFERQIARELPLHEREWALYPGADVLDLLDRVRRLELDPIDAGILLVGQEPPEAVVEAAVHRVAGIALRNDHEMGTAFVLHRTPR